MEERAEEPSASLSSSLGQPVESFPNLLLGSHNMSETQSNSLHEAVSGRGGFSALDSPYEPMVHGSFTPATRNSAFTAAAKSTAFPFALQRGDLLQRDPKLYPLASSLVPTPLEGSPTLLSSGSEYFQAFYGATDSQSKKFTQHSSAFGSTETVSSMMESTSQNLEWLLAKPKSSPMNSRKRAASPSDDEASQSFEEEFRPVKRRRHVDPRRNLEEPQVGPSPITPGIRRPRQHEKTVDIEESDAQRLSQLSSYPRLAGILDNSDNTDRVTAPLSPPSFPEQGMVATPPVAEQDLELEDSFAEEMGNGSAKRPSLQVDSTPPPQEAALPSPVLSPISAASSPDVCSDEEAEKEEITSNSLQLFGIEAITPSSDAPSSQLVSASLPNWKQILDFYDGMPEEAQLHLMHQMLRRTQKPLLQYVADVINPVLKCDFIARLPTELALLIIRNMDVKTLCRAAQVSKKWRELIDNDDKTWRNLLKQDGFELPPGELERAHHEGWAWQGSMPYEKDLSDDLDLNVSPPENPLMIQWGRSQTLFDSRFSPKPQHDDSALQETRFSMISPKTITSGTPDDYQYKESPLEANIPELGLKSLRTPHIYKTLYRRHYNFDKSWMWENTKPYHLAFRAHGRHVVTCLQFDDDKILTGSDDTKIHIYDSSTGALRRVLDGHEGGVWALRYEGNTLVSGSTDRTVRVWDMEMGRCTHIFYGHTSTVRCLVILQPTVIGENPDGSPIIMPKEPLIITGSRDSTLRIWRLPDIENVRFDNDSMPPPLYDDKNPYFLRMLQGHLHSVRAIAAYGDTLVSGSYDSTVRVWKISTGETLHRLNGHTSKVYSVVLDHERQRCISGSMDNMVKVWSLATGECVFNLEGHTSLVGLLELSHGRLVSAAADSTLRVWDPNTGFCKNTLSAHTGAITCFQHDGQKVISGSDRSLKMWNIKTGECVTDLLSDLSGGWQVRFNYRKCVAAVQRRSKTYIEVLDFGAAQDGVPAHKLGTRTVVDEFGNEVEDASDDDDE